MKRTIMTIYFIVSMANLCFGQESKKWSLNECMQYAIENSHRTSRQTSQNSIYHQEYLEAIGNLLPSINANTSANFGFGRAKDEDTGGYGNLNSFSNDYGVSASLIIFDGLTNITRVKMGKIGKMMGKQKLEEEKDMVAYNTMEAFFSVLYNTDLEKIAEQQLVESSKNVQQITRMKELGIKGFPDIAEMEAKAAEDLYNLTKQKNILTLSIIVLKEKMNYPINEDLMIENSTSERIITKIDDTPYAIYNESIGYNPKALAAESQTEIQKLNHRASKGNLLPRISLNAGVTTNFFRYMDGSDYTSFGDQFKNKRGEYIGFTLSIPLFNGFSRSASVKKAKAQMYISQVNKDEVLRTLYSEIEQAVADVNGQVDEYYQAVKQKKAAHVAHKVNQRKYDEGMIDPIVLHTSSNRLVKAKAEELNAMLKYQLKYKLVNYYKGQSFLSQK